MNRFLMSSMLAVCIAYNGVAPAQSVDRPGNVVGGGVAWMSGGSDNLVIIYGDAGAGEGGAALRLLQGRSARLVGNGGDGPDVEYLEPAPPQKGRWALMNGGGEDREIVYSGSLGAVNRRR